MRGLFLFAAFLAAATFAQEAVNRPVQAVRLASPPVIDGDISDEVWKTAPEVTGFWDAVNSVQVSDQTKVRIGYDDRFIYVAFDIYDSKPDEILGRETQEDSRFGSMQMNTEDCVDIRLDPFKAGLSRDQIWFSVNAIGTRSVYFGGGRGKKTEWKGEWLAATKRTDHGWTAEMRIPWRMLNYPDRRSAQSMGINFSRYHYRTKVQSFWSNIGPNQREELEGIWRDVVVPALPKPKVSILPYILPGYDDNNRPTFRSGVDARFPITSEVTAVASLNPDFGTIEGAVDSVGFTRSERFLPERRPFFLEGSGFFQSGDSFEIGNLFYPRRIDRFDLGTKVYGKLNAKDSIGLLNTITFGDRMDFVGRWRHLFSPRENIEFFANVKDATNDRANVGAVAYNKEWNKLGVTAKVAESNDNGIDAFANHYAIYYQDKRNLTFLYYNDTNKNYRLPDGLINFTGIRGWSIYENVNYEWRHGPIRSMVVEMFGDYDSLEDGTPFNRGVGGDGTIAFNHSDMGINFNASDYYFDHLEDRLFQVRVTKGVDNRFANIGLGFATGVLSSEPATLWGPKLAYRVAKGLDFSYQGLFQNWVGQTKQNILTASYEVSPTKQFGSRMVETDGDVNWYLSYRDSGKKGTEWFAILGDPNARKFRRMVQVKLVFSF